MPDVTNESIYEVLKAVQTRMSAMQIDIAILHEAFGALDIRIARIERRLDIIDTPAS